MKRFFPDHIPFAVCVAMLTLFAPDVQGQAYDPAKKYTEAELKKDFAVMRSALEYMHPGIYWYSSRESIKKCLDSSYAQINRPMTEREFYWLLSPVLARVKCGHTYPRMSQAYEDAGGEEFTYLPMEVFWDGERLFVVSNRSTDSSLAPGDEIRSIGGMPVADLAREAREVQSADGGNAAWKNVMLDLYLIQEIYVNRYNGKPPFKLSVANRNGNIRETEVNRRPKTTQPVKPATALSKKQQKKADRERENEEQVSMVKFRFAGADSATAILKISGFGYEKVHGVSYNKMHAAIFSSIAEKKVPNLIIDLRGNSGGNGEIAEDLMSYLVNKPVRVFDHNEFYSENLAYVDSLKPYFEKQPASHSFQKSRLKKVGENLYRFRFEGKEGRNPARRYRFDGNVYILTDGWVFSAGSLFVSSLKSQRNVTVLGTETGGGAIGCSGGRISRLILPNTGIRIMFPHVRVYAVTDAKADGHGVQPDYPIRRTWEDRAQKRDPELQKTMELIRGTGTN